MKNIKILVGIDSQNPLLRRFVLLSTPERSMTLIFSIANIADTLGDLYGQPPIKADFEKQNQELQNFIEVDPDVNKAFINFFNDFKDMPQENYRCVLSNIAGDIKVSLDPRHQK